MKRLLILINGCCASFRQMCWLMAILKIKWIIPEVAPASFGTVSFTVEVR